MPARFGHLLKVFKVLNLSDVFSIICCTLFGMYVKLKGILQSLVGLRVCWRPSGSWDAAILLLRAGHV